MILEAYAVSDNPQPLVAAPPRRDWMDAFSSRHPYRCLPLAIANCYGWQLLLPVDVIAEWSGGPGIQDLRVECGNTYQAVSHFKRGILTFDVGYIFRTPPGYHLLVTGPINNFKHRVAPMTAVIETDWLPYTFTFNYKFMRRGQVRWEKGEPYAQIYVVPAGLQESFQPVIRRLEDNPTLTAEFEAWRSRRSELRQRQDNNDPAAWKEAWGKDYFLGRYANGRRTEADHTNKLRLKDPIDTRQGMSVKC